MKKQSARRAAQQRVDGPKRKKYLEGRLCVVTRRPANQVHEMLGAAVRHKTVADERFWLAVSDEGHRLIQDAPKAQQLAFKMVFDYDNYDLAAFNELYRIGGKDWPILQEQVLSYMEVPLG